MQVALYILLISNFGIFVERCEQEESLYIILDEEEFDWQPFPKVYYEGDLFSIVCFMTRAFDDKDDIYMVSPFCFEVEPSADFIDDVSNLNGVQWRKKDLDEYLLNNFLSYAEATRTNIDQHDCSHLLNLYLEVFVVVKKDKYSRYLIGRVKGCTSFET